MTREELNAIVSEAHKNVRVCCCEYHVHSWRRGCYRADSAKDEAIAQLADALDLAKSALRGLSKTTDDRVNDILRSLGEAE